MAPRQLATYKGIEMLSFLRSGFSQATLFAGLLGMSAVTHADATLNFLDQANKTGSVQTSNGLVRIEQASAAGVYMLFDSRSKQLTVVNAKSKSYQLITKERIAATSAQITAARDQLKANFHKLPSAQQQQLKPVLDQMLLAEKAKKEIKPSSTTSIAGIQCKQHEVLVDRQLVQSICSANAKALGVSPSDYQNIAGMLDMLAEISRNLSGGSTTAGVSPKEIGGLPVSTTDPKTKNFNRLESISTAKVAPERFTIPKGFSQASN